MSCVFTFCWQILPIFKKCFQQKIPTYSLFNVEQEENKTKAAACWDQTMWMHEWAFICMVQRERKWLKKKKKQWNGYFLLSNQNVKTWVHRMTQYLTHEKGLAAVFFRLYLGGFVNKAPVNVSLFLRLSKENLNWFKGGKPKYHLCWPLQENSAIHFCGSQTHTHTHTHTRTHTYAQHALHTCTSTTNLCAIINNMTKVWLSCPLRT